MSTKEKAEGTKRRAFLRFAGLGTVGGAAAALAGQSQPAEAADDLPPGAAGYRETEHVRKVYETARF
ncbi:MAG: twin-arginine translocation signal domain-containing protein [Geminicoccaceae bacterium]